MLGVIIRDGTQHGSGGLCFGLAEVLKVLGRRALTSRWRCRTLHYVSKDEKDIEVLTRACSGDSTVQGTDLLAATENLMQVIDGEFEGVEEPSSTPWVVVRAVDSSWWEVLSNDQAVLDAIHVGFKAVSDIAPGAVMQQRKGEKAGWIGGWLGGFLWLCLLSILWLVQGRTTSGAVGLALFVAAVLAILTLAPWKHPGTRYWKLMLPIYAVLAASVGLWVWRGGGPSRLGLSWWSLFLLMPVLIPLATAGTRCWMDGDARHPRSMDAASHGDGRDDG